MSDTITVYEFEIFDPRRRAWTKAPRMGTLEAIAAASGVPLKNSALVVDAMKVGADGFIQAARLVGDDV
jgi:hypothetical protein